MISQPHVNKLCTSQMEATFRNSILQLLLHAYPVFSLLLPELEVPEAHNSGKTSLCNCPNEAIRVIPDGRNQII